MRFRPTTEAVKAIAVYRAERKQGRRPRPRAKDLCRQFGFGETTLRKIARVLVP